jgi:hypothetical protein
VQVSITREEALAFEALEREAWRDLWDATPAARHATLGLRALERDGVLALASDHMESLLQNRVRGLGLTVPAEATLLDAVVAHYRPGQGFAINLCPFAEPVGLESELRRRGFATFFHHLRWVRGAAPVKPVGTTLEIAPVGRERADEWARTYAEIHDLPADFAAWTAEAIGRPRWMHLLALEHGRAVAAAAMFVHEGRAWLGKTGTLPSHRRMGAQGALLAARLREGLARGVHAFTLETAPDWPDLPGGSLRNAARAGFRPAYERPSWILGHAG